HAEVIASSDESDHSDSDSYSTETKSADEGDIVDPEIEEDEEAEHPDEVVVDDATPVVATTSTGFTHSFLVRICVPMVESMPCIE
ncbi:hypothetical protein PENTCL1PPCAC_4749, partial [Pristionchus entomophagus]